MSEENVEFVRSILAAWKKGDYSSTDWADGDIVFVEPMFEGAETRGIDGIRRRWKEFLGAWDTVRDGKVVRLVLYSTREEAFKAVGLSE